MRKELSILSRFGESEFLPLLHDFCYVFYIFVGYQVNLGHRCCYFLLYTILFWAFVPVLSGIIPSDESIFILDVNDIWLQWTFAIFLFAGS